MSSLSTELQTLQSFLEEDKKILLLLKTRSQDTDITEEQRQKAYAEYLVQRQSVKNSIDQIAKITELSTRSQARDAIPRQQILLFMQQLLGAIRRATNDNKQLLINVQRELRILADKFQLTPHPNDLTNSSKTKPNARTLQAELDLPNPVHPNTNAPNQQKSNERKTTPNEIEEFDPTSICFVS